ncbi:MAG: biotin--[acetyl-CoA-carboxylase] ligase [Phycisphaerales bacterium JB065]
MPPSDSHSSCHAGSPETIEIAGQSVLVHRFDAVGSTNDLARQWLQENPTPRPAAWVAASQSAGKGTRGRSWASPHGGLWMSVAMPLGDSPEQALPGLGIRVGLAAYRAARSIVTESIAERLKLRWPNDLVIETEAGTVLKLGGTLIDHISSSVVVGIGINANNPAPRTDAAGTPLRTPAGSLCEFTGTKIPIHKLEIHLLTELCALIPLHGLPDDLEPELNRALHRPGHPVTVVPRSGEIFSGMIAGISRASETVGALLIDRPDGSQTTVTSGEIR